jgi:hypothetical protein
MAGTTTHGIVKTNVLPLDTCDVTCVVPPSNCTKSLTIASPKPIQTQETSYTFHSTVTERQLHIYT